MLIARGCHMVQGMVTDLVWRTMQWVSHALTDLEGFLFLLFGHVLPCVDCIYLSRLKAELQTEEGRDVLK